MASVEAYLALQLSQHHGEAGDASNITAQVIEPTGHVARRGHSLPVLYSLLFHINSTIARCFAYIQKR